MCITILLEYVRELLLVCVVRREGVWKKAREKLGEKSANAAVKRLHVLLTPIRNSKYRRKRRPTKQSSYERLQTPNPHPPPVWRYVGTNVKDIFENARWNLMRTFLIEFLFRATAENGCV